MPHDKHVATDETTDEKSQAPENTDGPMVHKPTGRYHKNKTKNTNRVNHIASCWLAEHYDIRRTKQRVSRAGSTLSLLVSLALSLCSSVYLPACLSVCLPACLPVCLSVFLPACLSICRSDRLPACLPVRLSVCLTICLSACPSICGSDRPSDHLSVCLPVCLSVSF